MNEKVQTYLENARAKKAASEKSKRDDLLISVGLYEKEYYTEGADPADYPEIEYQNDNRVRYRLVGCEVTDEEYQEIASLNRVNEPAARNGIAVSLKVLAWIQLVAGLLGALALIDAEVLALSLALGGVVMFILTCGLSEIIRLLHEINQK